MLIYYFDNVQLAPTNTQNEVFKEDHMILRLKDTPTSLETTVFGSVVYNIEMVCSRLKPMINMYIYKYLSMSFLFQCVRSWSGLVQLIAINILQKEFLLRLFSYTRFVEDIIDSPLLKPSIISSTISQLQRESCRIVKIKPILLCE